jgi:hypothetical protein
MTDDEAYDRAFDILTETLAGMGREGIARTQVILPMADFLTAIALIIDGEAGVRALMDHMVRRIAEWHAGTFPQPDRQASNDDGRR